MSMHRWLVYTCTMMLKMPDDDSWSPNACSGVKGSPGILEFRKGGSSVSPQVVLLQFDGDSRLDLTQRRFFRFLPPHSPSLRRVYVLFDRAQSRAVARGNANRSHGQQRRPWRRIFCNLTRWKIYEHRKLSRLDELRTTFLHFTGISCALLSSDEPLWFQ